MEDSSPTHKRKKIDTNVDTSMDDKYNFTWVPTLIKTLMNENGACENVSRRIICRSIEKIDPHCRANIGRKLEAAIMEEVANWSNERKDLLEAICLIEDDLEKDGSKYSWEHETSHGFWDGTWHVKLGDYQEEGGYCGEKLDGMVECNSLDEWISKNDKIDPKVIQYLKRIRLCIQHELSKLKCI